MLEIKKATLADRFSQIFREEHRTVRDTLLDLVQAFEERDKARIRFLLNAAATFVGPHFCYEEEAMYPALVEIFGLEYVDKLLGDHDRAIGIAERLVELTGKERLTDEDVLIAARLIRSGGLPHVSDCDGLSIMVERLPDKKVQAILDARDRSARVWICFDGSNRLGSGWSSCRSNGLQVRIDSSECALLLVDHARGQRMYKVELNLPRRNKK